MKVGGVRSAEASETSAKTATTPASSALGAFSALLQPDRDRQGVSGGIAHGQSGGGFARNNKKKFPATRSAGLSTGTNPNTESKADVSIQFASSPVVAGFGITSLPGATQPAEKIAPESLRVSTVSEGPKGRKVEVGARQPRSAMAAKGTQAEVENDDAEAASPTEQNASIGDLQSRALPSLSKESGPLAPEITKRNSESIGEIASTPTVQSGSGSAGATSPLLAVSRTGPSSAEIDIASLSDTGGAPHNSPSNVALAPSLPEAASPSAAGERGALATQTASRDIGLLLSVYDAVAEDITLAGEAAAANDLAARCRYSQHAFLLLGHLESWVSLLEDAMLEQSLLCFYQYLRSELLRLQGSRSSEEFAALAMLVCETRSAWQTKQARALSPTQPDSLAAGLSEQILDSSEGESRAGWSA